MSESRKLRHKRIRGQIEGTAEKLRLSVFRSNKHIYAQLINDRQGKVMAAAHDLDLKKGTKTEKARRVGEKIAEEAQEQDIQKVVFDRGGYRYHGRVKALAEGARQQGLEF